MRPVRCWRCDAEHPPAFFCPSCGAVQRLAGDADYFDLLELPAHPSVDAKKLETLYYDLSRKLHPDRYQTGSSEEQQASVRATAVLNAAFRTLRDVETLGRYWLERSGEALGRDNNRVPSNLAAYVFDVQEKLAEARAESSAQGREALAETRSDLAQRLADRRRELQELLGRWPQGGQNGERDRARAELKERLSELSYLRTLDRDVQATLKG